jgi:hypothetical protein
LIRDLSIFALQFFRDSKHPLLRARMGAHAPIFKRESGRIRRKSVNNRRARKELTQDWYD